MQSGQRICLGFFCIFAYHKKHYNSVRIANVIQAVPVTPSASVTGVYAPTDANRGVGKSPARIHASLAGLTAMVAAIVSEYVGETEKNLLEFFSDAELNRPGFLFDEADALVGKRSEMKDAHDCFALATSTDL